MLKTELVLKFRIAFAMLGEEEQVGKSKQT